MDQHLPPGEGDFQGFASPFSQMMAEEREMARPEPVARARQLNALPKGKYRFRTKPEAGRKRFEIPLLIPHIGKEDAAYEQAHERYRRWAQRQKRKNEQDPQQGIPGSEFQTANMILKRDKAVFEELHEYKIKFSPIRRSRECVYVTDNPIIADYIRWRCSLGHFPYVVEDVRPLMVKIGDQEFPVGMLNDEGQRALAKLVASGVDLDALVVKGVSE